MADTTHANRKEKSEESYDLYDGEDNAGLEGIIDNPSIHIYIAHQIMSTETEGEQYVAPATTSTVGGTATMPTTSTTTTPTDASGSNNGGSSKNKSGTTKPNVSYLGTMSKAGAGGKSTR